MEMLSEHDCTQPWKSDSQSNQQQMKRADPLPPASSTTPIPQRSLQSSYPTILKQQHSCIAYNEQHCDQQQQQLDDHSRGTLTRTRIHIPDCNSTRSLPLQFLLSPTSLNSPSWKLDQPPNQAASTGLVTHGQSFYCAVSTQVRKGAYSGHEVEPFTRERRKIVNLRRRWRPLEAKSTKLKLHIQEDLTALCDVTLKLMKKLTVYQCSPACFVRGQQDDVFQRNWARHHDKLTNSFADRWGGGP